MVLGLFPEDLDGVELRTVGRQVQRHKLVHKQPLLAQVAVQVVVNAGVVHHRKCPLVRVTAASEFVQKLRGVAAASAALVGTRR